MKKTVAELAQQALDRVVIESVDLSLYIAHAEAGRRRWLICDREGRPLKTRNLLDMKKALASLQATERVLEQRSAYDEMVGNASPPCDNSLQIPLGPASETLPFWEH